MRIFISMLLVIPAAGLAAELRLDDFPGLIEANGDLRAALERIQGAEARQGYVGRSFLPRIKGQYGQEHFTLGPGRASWQPYWGVDASVNVYNGGRDGLEEDVRRADARIAQQDQRAVRMEGLTRLRKIYGEWLFQAELKQILTEGGRANDENMGLARRRIQSGIATATDRIDFEQNGLVLAQSRARLEVDVFTSERSIKALLALPDGEALVSRESNTHLHHDELLATAFSAEAHREYRGLLAQEERQRGMTAAQSRWWAPRADVYGAFTQYTDRQQWFGVRDQREDVAVGAVVSMPLFDGGDGLREKRAGRLRLNAIEQELRQKKRDLEARHAAATARLKLTHDLIHQAEENAGLAREYYRLTFGEYNRGVKNSPDVLQALQRRVTAEIGLAQTRLDYHLARAEVMSLLGI